MKKDNVFWALNLKNEHFDVHSNITISSNSLLHQISSSYYAVRYLDSI